MASVSVTALLLHPEEDGSFKFLVGKTSSGVYQLPGGNLDYGASWSNFAHKQVLQKTDLDINPSDFKFCFVSNDKIPVQNGKNTNRHYVDIIMSTIYKGDKNLIKNKDSKYFDNLEWRDIRYHGIDEDKIFGALKAVLSSSMFHPVRSNAYSEYVSNDNLNQLSINKQNDDNKESNSSGDDSKEQNGKKQRKKPKLDCPFVTIDDEMYQIKEDGVNASMNVTSYEGELLPPFLSAKGISWLNENFRTNKLDIFIDTFAKSGTTLTIKLVHQVWIDCMKMDVVFK